MPQPESLEESGIRLRPLVPGEDATALVCDSWVRSYADSGWAREVGHAYHRHHRELVNELVARCPVLLAHWDEDPDVIVGWACTAGPLLVHYVYVKHKFRGHALWRRLLAPYLGPVDMPVVYTHRFPGRQRKDAYEPFPAPSIWTYNPYLLLKG